MTSGISLYPKKLFLLVLLTLILHGSVVLNGFAGDDAIIFINNTFYRSFSNIGMLFSQDYTTRPEVLIKHESANKGSGSIAYRPVLSLTYFLDVKLWGDKAGGLHGTNLLLHLLNTILIFLLLSEFFISPQAAFVAAILFSAHPVQSEAVAAIGYRADLLVVFFSLLSLGCWCIFRRQGAGLWAAGAVAVFFLAIFSKETALFLPLMFILYDRLYPGNFRAKTDSVWFLLFGAVMALYLYCYVIIFPNQTVLGVWGGWSLLKHAGLVITALGINLRAFCLPANLISFPGLYLPRLLSAVTIEFWVLFFLCAGYFIWVIRAIVIKDRPVFWGLWFLLTYLPVSNLIPTWNPIALRYLYMPGIAVWVLLGVLYDKVYQGNAPAFKGLARWGMVLLIGLCASATFYNERLWKDNMTIGLAWIAKYPKDHKGYEVAGEAAVNAGNYDDGIKYNEMAIALAPFTDETPSAPVIGMVKAYLAKNDVMSAELYLRTYMKVDRYPVGMFLLGHIFEQKGDVAAALHAYADAVQGSSDYKYGEDMIRLSLQFSEYAAAAWAFDQEMARADSIETKKIWQYVYAHYLNEYVYDDTRKVCSLNLR